MNLDIPVLVGSLCAIVLSLIWSRATTVRPVLFAWAGAGAGGVVAFIRHFDPAQDRVSILHIIPMAELGAGCGLLPGFAVRAAYVHGNNRRKATLEAIAAAALSASLGMVVGWIVHRRDDDSIPMALLYGAAFATVGVVLALLNWRLRSHQMKQSQAISRLR